MYWPIIFCICLASVTYIIPMATANVGGRYTAMMFMPCASGESAFRLERAKLSL